MLSVTVLYNICPILACEISRIHLVKISIFPSFLISNISQHEKDTHVSLLMLRFNQVLSFCHFELSETLNIGYARDKAKLLAARRQAGRQLSGTFVFRNVRSYDFEKNKNSHSPRDI